MNIFLKVNETPKINGREYDSSLIYNQAFESKLVKD